MDDSHPVPHPPAPFLVTAEGTRSLTRAQTRSKSFELTSRGVRMAAGSDQTTRWIAAHLPLNPDCVLSHETAAHLLGLPLPVRLREPGLAHVTAPRETFRPRRRDIVTHHAQLPESDITPLGAFRITRPERTYVDLAARIGFADLVAVGDVVLRDHGSSQEHLLAVAQARGRYPGRGQAVRAIAWLDARAASPRESHLRVLLRKARLPTPEVNALILDEHGGFLAIGDLVFRRQRVVVEYDGEVHAPMAQRARDAARRALLREHGWVIVEIVGQDMGHPRRVVDRVRSALRDGAARRRPR